MTKRTYEDLKSRLMEVPGAKEYIDSYPVKREMAILKSRKRAWIMPKEMRMILKRAIFTRNKYKS